MRSLFQAAVAVSILSLSGSALLAQSDTNTGTPPVKNEAQTGQTTTGPDTSTTGVGSRALGESKTEIDPGKAKRPDGQLDIQRLDKQGRGGQQN